MTARHASGDTDGQCDACCEDESPAIAHEAEVVGTDDEGPYCWCGHMVEVTP